jgi:pimeloyl-ACP methyl ester carboxylesterase
MALLRRKHGRPLPGQIGIAAREYRAALVSTLSRPLGFLPMPGASVRGPRPIIVVHGYAMSETCYWPLARRLANAGLGPIVGYEYWTLGKVVEAARGLADLAAQAMREAGTDSVDVIGHSMGGVVARYWVSLAGGDAHVRRLITIGSPHAGTEISAIGLGRPKKELQVGSVLMQRLAAAPPPERTAVTIIWSRGDALVPGRRHARLSPDASVTDEIVFDDLGHMSLLASERVADLIIDRLRTPVATAAVPRAR